MAEPRTCVRCEHAGVASEFVGGICPVCDWPSFSRDLVCPGCNKVGEWLSRRGCWLCPNCVDPRSRIALYHTCEDGVVRIIPEIVNGFCCSVCKLPTWEYTNPNKKT